MSEKKVAFVTGANKGLGLETARQLGALGYKVILGSRDAARGETAVATLQAEGIDAELQVVDMGDRTSIDSAIAALNARLAQLDVLVNNAGVQLEMRDEWLGSTTSRVSQDDLRATFDVNFFGVVQLTNGLLPLLKKSEAGRIVHLSSILGSLALHSDPQSPIYETKVFGYNASKTALNAYTVHLAYELKDTPIKVNSAHPGWVKTDMGGEMAPMGLQEGAKTAVQLATLPADGPTGTYVHQGKHLPW